MRNDDLQALVARIKQLDLQSSMEFYGVRFNRNGFALCPFHEEDTPSLKIRNGWYHCFGCGVNGDLIQFVRRRANCAFREAVEQIASDFHISRGRATLSERLRHSRSEARREARILALKGAEDDYLACLSAWLDSVEAAEKARIAGPFSKTTADAYWREHKTYAALSDSESRRWEVHQCWQ